MGNDTDTAKREPAQGQGSQAGTPAPPTPAPPTPASPASAPASAAPPTAKAAAAPVELTCIQPFQHAGRDYRPTREERQGQHLNKLPADRGKFDSVTAAGLLKLGVAVRSADYKEGK